VIKKVKRLARWIKKSNHFTAFTGAGISTSAGIPDFRGPEGVWTLGAQGKSPKNSVSTLKAMPTVCHMSLVELQNKGYLKYLISQNCDGLHRRSGILPNKISELHGNSNLERCIKCGKDYLRDYDATADYEKSVHDHRTGRNCVVCNGDLHDTIINFGENLPPEPLQKAFDHTLLSDLMLVLGSSLTVRPACTMPRKLAKAGKKLVICNLQRTDLDDIAAMVIHAKCDVVMQLLMKELALDVPTFLLQRRVIVEQLPKTLTLRAIDVDDTPATIFRAVQYKQLKSTDKFKTVKEEPFEIKLKGIKDEVGVRLHFMGHYNEPVVDLSFKVDKEDEKSLLEMFYNPKTGEWKVDALPYTAPDTNKSVANK
jgi:mono-ADP-ribosyltransferase sirtuin 6